MEHRLSVLGRLWSVCLISVLLPLAGPLLGGQAFDDLGLDNPILTSQEQINQKLKECQTLLDSLGRQERQGTLSSSQQRLKALASLYVVFAGPAIRRPGVEPGRLELIDLAKTSDSAVRVLRDQVEIPCPRGLVFVRYYASRHVMPLEILPAFSREHTRGATILSRYIAILEETASDPAQQRILQKGQDRVLSHELVHAYINSALGRDRDRLPLWFHEGCATYCSGSPGGACVSALVQTPVGFRHVLFQDQAPRDYQQYRLMFDYLRAKLGRQDLYAQIRRAIATRSVQSLLGAGQVSDVETLLGKAQIWHYRRNLIRYSVAAALVIGLLYAVWRVLPKKPGQTEPVV